VNHITSIKLAQNAGQYSQYVLSSTQANTSNKSLLDLSVLDNKCVAFPHYPQLPNPLLWPQAKVDIVQ